MDRTVVGVIILAILIGAGAIISGIIDYQRNHRKQFKFIPDDMLQTMSDIMYGCSLDCLWDFKCLPFSDYSFAIQNDLNNQRLSWKITGETVINAPDGSRYVLFETNCNDMRYFLADDEMLVRMVDFRIHLNHPVKTASEPAAPERIIGNDGHAFNHDELNEILAGTGNIKPNDYGDYVHDENLIPIK